MELSKLMMKFKKQRKLLTIFMAVCFTFCLIAGILAFVKAGLLVYDSQIKNPYDDHVFNRKIWLSNANNHDTYNPRGQMVDDLREEYLHKNMLKTEIRIFLGKPTEVLRYEDRYFLGHWGFMSIDGDYLILHYNKKGMLTSTAIYSH